MGQGNRPFISYFLRQTKLLLACVGINFSAQATTLSFTVDNDGIFLMDREYTSGLFLRLANKPNDFGYSIELASQIWTPSNIDMLDAQPTQRPFAGLLYLQGRAHYQTSDLALKTSLMLGVVGPKSQAESIQSFAHKIIGSPMPKRWDLQIEHENIVQFGFEAHSLLYRDNEHHLDFGLQTRGQIGNFQSELALGGGFRFGLNLQQSFGSTSLALNNKIDTDLLENSPEGMFFYLMAEGRLRANDITIEGKRPEVFRDQRIKHGQAAVSTGVVYYRGAWGLGSTFTWQSQQYHAARAKDHSFANITLFYRF